MLERIQSPADLADLGPEELATLCEEIRSFIVESVSKTGGHLGSNLGAVELTVALHRVFRSPHDIILWDTGHQAYVHKILTGRRALFDSLRQEGGLSGYPSRAESDHDWVENSHASTALSYAHGLTSALDLLEGPARDRHVVAVVGDGALTGGMAYEALNNLGHSGRRCIIVLNDNGRSYAPTVSKLSESITRLRLNPSYVQTRQRLKQMLRDLPAVGGIAYTSVHGLMSALREMVEPHVFFEALGVRYTGPIPGHDVIRVEEALRHAATWQEGPIVVHVLTEKGHGYGPAVEDEVQRLHDLKVPARPAAPAGGGAGESDYERRSYTEVFTESLIELAAEDPRIVAITAAMPGPTGLLPFQEKFPERFFDVGIAEQHAVTAAAGMAMGGLRPVVAVYSTFFCRAFDQANLDVGLHRLPVTFVLDRAGITGDDGPSHHGVLDLMLGLAIPDMAVFAPSSPSDLPALLGAALGWEGPSMVRFPKTPGQVRADLDEVAPMAARRLARGTDVAILAVGKMVEAAEGAARILEGQGISATLWDVRVVRPADPAMIADAAQHPLVVTVEDGISHGGAGTFLGSLIANVAVSTAGGGTPRVVSLGTPVAYIAQAKPDAILARLGLDAEGVARSVAEALGAIRAPGGASVATDTP